MKDNSEVISEFNEYVNMTASELEKWLKSDDSNGAGWTKDGGEGGGESVGHESGRNIVDILKSNPDKNPDKYTDDQLQHMRKVASYCKRHLAQEASGNKDKDAEDVKKSKSYISLKNWGHDFLKAQGKESGSANGNGKSGSNEKEKEEEEEENGDDEQEKEEEKDKKAGDKRKSSGQQNGSNKKQETRKTRSSDKNESEGEDEKEDGDEKEGNNDDAEEEEQEQKQEEEEEANEKNGNSESNGSSKKGPKKNDTVSWNWGNGNPKGKVLDVKEEKATITTKRGNEVSRDGDSEDPAVILDTGKSKAIKSAHELN